MAPVGITFSLISIALFVSGCSSGNEAQTSALGQTLDAAGFLIATDITPDAADSDKFLISCAYKSGVKQISYSRADVEQNKICPLEGGAVENQGVVDETTKSDAGSSVAGGQSTVKLTENRYTFVKARPNMIVSGNEPTLTSGTDYCVIAANFEVATACKVASSADVKVTGFSISECTLKVGYLWSGHVAVTPTPPECQ
jgi:hypothetical protein